MGDIVYFRDYQSSKAKAQYESIFPSLEQQAVEIMNVALLGNPHDAAIYESSLGFVAPSDDCA